MSMVMVTCVWGVWGVWADDWTVGVSVDVCGFAALILVRVYVADWDAGLMKSWRGRGLLGRRDSPGEYG